MPTSQTGRLRETPIIRPNTFFLPEFWIFRILSLPWFTADKRRKRKREREREREREIQLIVCFVCFLFVHSPERKTDGIRIPQPPLRFQERERRTDNPSIQPTNLLARTIAERRGFEYDKNNDSSDDRGRRKQSGYLADRRFHTESSRVFTAVRDGPCEFGSHRMRCYYQRAARKGSGKEEE